MPEISVIIPTFNRAEMLRKAISSVLAQTGSDIEVIVSDNCSTDHTRQVVAEFSYDLRLRYFRNDSNLGMVANWKQAIFELARAEWFVLMSDDDYFTDNDYLRRATMAIREHQPKFVYGGGFVNDVVGGTSQQVKLPFDGLVPGCKVFGSRGITQPQDAILCNMVFRVSDAKRLGFLSDGDNLSCDSELYLMLCAEGNVFSMPEPVSVYLKHGANLVDRIKTSRCLLDKNLNHLVYPFAYAVRCGMDKKYTDAFRINTNFEKSISSTLLKLWLHDEKWYFASKDRLSRIIPELLLVIEAGFNYRLKRILLGGARSYFRRRYPLIDG